MYYPRVRERYANQRKMWHISPKTMGGDMPPSKTVVIGALVIVGVFYLATGVSNDNSWCALIVGGISMGVALGRVEDQS